MSALDPRDAGGTPSGAALPCPSCGAPLTDAFCAACGERRPGPSDRSLAALLGQACEAVFSLDGKLLRTLRLLVTRPGFLSAQWSRGARVRYVKPLQLFVLANLAYFFLQPFTGASTFATPLASHLGRQLYSPLARSLVEEELAARDLSLEEFELRFDARGDRLSRSLIFLLWLLIAPAVALTQLGGERRWVEHLILALHFTCWMLLGALVAFAFVLRALLAVWHPPSPEMFLSGATFLLLGAWLALAFRRFYGNGRWSALARVLGFLPLLLVVFVTYRFTLFLVTLASL